MTGLESVQGLVVVFVLVLLAILIAFILGGSRRKKIEKQENKLKSESLVPVKDDGITRADSDTKIESIAIADGKTKELGIAKEVRKTEVVSVAAETPLDPAETLEEKRAASSPMASIDGTKAESNLSNKVEQRTSLEKSLSTTKQRLWGRIQALWSSQPSVDLEEIEEILYTSDLGPQTVERLFDKIKKSLSNSERKDSELVRSVMREEILEIFRKTQGTHFNEDQGDFGVEGGDEAAFAKLFNQFEFHSPSVWMVVGVNGAGKTTSIGKIAAQLAQSGKKVLLAAGDTFRAAAGSQLKVWTDRAQVEIFSPEGVTDPSAVAFDGVQKGIAKGFDVIIVDTAGRLHTQHNLMEEIKKMKRVIQKVLPEAPHETLLVLDSNQGQNALLQAKEFHKALGLTGVVLTKLDGSAKGGVAVGVAHELELPIKLIGVGEKIGDLRSFSAKRFVESIL